MKTIFEDLSKSEYLELSGYPKYLLKLNSEFSKIGIKKVVLNKKLEEDEISEELILFVMPNYSNVNMDYFTFNSEIYDYLNSNGFYSVKSEYNKLRNINQEEIKIKINDIECIIGFYLRERNIILINIPLFSYNWSDKFELQLSISRSIIDALIRLKIKEVNTKGLIEKLKIEKFLSDAKREITRLGSDLKSYTENIENHKKYLLEETEKLNSSYAKLNGLKELLSKSFKTVYSKIEEIKKLPFVKKVEFTNNGIAVDIGEIAITVKGTKRIIGRFRIYIKPSQIKIYNFDAIVRSGDYYDHPHVTNTVLCMGNWIIKICEALGDLDLKKLILILKMCLQTYNEKSPYIKIEEWDQYRKKQKLNLKSKEPEIGHERDYLNKHTNSSSEVEYQETQE